MIYNMYVVQDVKTGYLMPTVDQNDAAAVRNFAHAIKQSASIMHTFAADFRLYHIGTYDSDLGIITSIPHVCIADGADFGDRE